MPESFDQYSHWYANSIGLINSVDYWYFLKNLPVKCDSILDIGCGAGALAHELSNSCSGVYGIDISKDLVIQAKRRYPELKIRVGDAHRLPFANQKFDCIVSHNTFHHLRREVALQEAIRCLKPGGRLIIVDVSRETNKLKNAVLHLLFLYRDIYLNVILIMKYGLVKTKAALSYLNGPEWRAHRLLDKKTEFTRPQTHTFRKYLSGSRFKCINYHVEGLVWDKPK